MSIYFTSDLHLGHKNAIKHTNRPFLSLKEMDDTLINNINEVVGEDDTLYILGDFTAFVKNINQAIDYRNRINCKNIHLLYGNHDHNYDEEYCFSSTQIYKKLNIDGARLILFHYPIIDWDLKYHGSYHLHGHQHNKKEYNLYNVRRNECIFDVGVDANDFKPVSLDYILSQKF